MNAATPQSTPPVVSVVGPASLFSDSAGAVPAPVGPQIIRWRAVTLNLGVLLDESGQARELSEITVNLFPDVTYTGIIEEVNVEGDGYTWIGHLKDVELSAFYIVYTSGVFIGHFASPLGIYEVSIAKDEVYRIIQIDQNRFPGGED